MSKDKETTRKLTELVGDMLTGQRVLHAALAELVLSLSERPIAQAGITLAAGLQRNREWRDATIAKYNAIAEAAGIDKLPT